MELIVSRSLPVQQVQTTRRSRSRVSGGDIREEQGFLPPHLSESGGEGSLWEGKGS